MAREDLEGLRGHGFADQDILDAVHIIGLWAWTPSPIGNLSDQRAFAGRTFLAPGKG
jgi:hypothetical protein